MWPVAGLTVVLLATGCVMNPAMTRAMAASVPHVKSPTFASKASWRTAILPPTLATAEYGAAVNALYDYAGMALMRTGRFTVVDRSLVDKLLEEQEFSYSGVVDAGTAVRLGKMLGAEAVFTISVGSVAHDDFFSDSPKQRDAALHVKAISVETAEVLYSAAGKAGDFEGATGALQSALDVALSPLAGS